MRRLLPLLALAACVEAPSLDTRISAAERAVTPAALTPLGPVLAAADALPAGPGFEGALRGAAAALGARAQAIPGTSAADPALDARLQDLATRADDLAAPALDGEAQRLAELEARAEALRAGGLTEAVRERLEAGPTVP